MKKLLTLLAMLTIFALAVAACGSNEPEAPPAQTNTPPPAEETPDDTTNDTQEETPEDPVAEGATQEITFALHNEYTTIDPGISNNSFAAEILSNTFEGLVTFCTSTGAIIPGQAESWTVSDDGLVWTFHLRQGLMWSDGSPLNANDFEWAWKRVLTPETVSQQTTPFKTYIYNAEEFFNGEVGPEELGIRAVDDNTFEVRLINPTGFFLDVIVSWPFSPVQQATVEANGERWTLEAETFVGNGPFRLAELSPGYLIVMEANPYYRDAANVHLDRVNFRYIPDLGTALLAFESGEIDGSRSIMAGELPRLRVDGAGVVTVPSFATVFYSVNVEREPLNDVNVRRALALALDRHAIINDVLQASAAPATGIVPPGAIFDGADFITGRVDVGLRPTANIEEAQAALAEAGFPNGEGFPPLSMHFWTNDNARRIAEAMAEMWITNLNIEVNIYNEEWPVLFETRLQPGDFYVAHTGWGGGFVHPMAFLPVFRSDDINNLSRFNHPEYDRIIAEAMAEVDPVRAFELMREADDLLITEFAVIPLHHSDNTMLMAPHVQDFFLTPSNLLFLRNARVVG
ncbi:MAG: peptide ABC transporter substrate-binding protein [Defluviitaleaceae bacterium]|nr:peptide ABC transporter substrate-binding protein [Defluviitaleaceae bacterium]